MVIFIILFLLASLSFFFLAKGIQSTNPERLSKEGKKLYNELMRNYFLSRGSLGSLELGTSPEANFYRENARRELEKWRYLATKDIFNHFLQKPLQ